MSPFPAESPLDPAGRVPDDLDKLVGGLAHEIKNPLSTIRLNLDLLAEELPDDSPLHRKARRRIDLVQRECGRLQDVLDRFLQFVRLRVGRFETCDLNVQLQGLLDFFRPQSVQAKVELIPYLESELPPVRLDREMFRGMLLNLFLNALQAMPSGGQLVLRTTAGVGPAEVLLELIDTGCGMTATSLDRAFEVFYSTKPSGTGLGLPWARKVVDGHGGRIELQSEPARGTRVAIFLPAHRPLE